MTMPRSSSTSVKRRSRTRSTNRNVPSLNCASQPCGIGSETAVGGDLAILLARALRIETGVQHAVVLLDGAEVAIDQRDHRLAGAALTRGQCRGEGRIMGVMRRIAPRPGVALAIQDRLDLGHLVMVHLHAHGVVGQLAVLRHGAVPADGAGGRIGQQQRVRIARAGRAPHAVTDHHAPRCFRCSAPWAPRPRARALRGQCIHVVVGKRGQAGPVTGTAVLRAAADAAVFTGAAAAARRTHTGSA